MSKPSHEDLLEGKVNTVSIINEPIEPENLTAREKAERRWRMTAELLNKEKHEGGKA
jgi:hypothetical protein